MELLESLTDAEAKAVSDARVLLRRISDIVCDPPGDAQAAYEQLQAIRREAYEDLNQILHENLIVCGAHWLIDNEIVDPEVTWSWNPRQTGQANEPDLQATLNGRTLVSAEATTSPEPQGQIDSRMRDTLMNLSTMPGQRFYFVRTASMRQRAETKIRRNRWDIRVVEIG